MKIAFKLAYKNLMNAGLRTLLNVGVLALVFVLILFFKGIMEGWNESAVIKQIDWEYAEGQLRHSDYEPENSFSFSDSHGQIPDYKNKGLVPVLVRQASVYPQGRLINTVLKGIETDQTIVKIPTQAFKNSDAKYPAVVGKRMASSLNVKVGDEVLLRWRDKNGTFDAGNITIVDIFDTDVASVDQSQIWMPIEKVWQMTSLTDQATYFLETNKSQPVTADNWTFESQSELLAPFREVIQTESIGGQVLYIILLSIALLAIFDTQVLSIFRRQREIGTYIALGMTRTMVLTIFTVEGTMYSIFASVLGTVVGIPLLLYFNHHGISLGGMSEGFSGMNIGDSIYPTLGIGLIISTILIIVLSSAVVSYLPARKISKLNPVLALKGKLQ